MRKKKDIVEICQDVTGLGLFGVVTTAYPKNWDEVLKTTKGYILHREIPEHLDKVCREMIAKENARKKRQKKWARFLNKIFFWRKCDKRRRK